MKQTPVIRISGTTIISTNAQAFWKVVRISQNIALWCPDVRESIIEDGGPGDRVGAVRVLHLQNRTLAKERLIAISDKDLTYSHSVIESTFPISHHSSTISFLAIEDGVSWPPGMRKSPLPRAIPTLWQMEFGSE